MSSDSTVVPLSAADHRSRLWALARLFFRLGATAFGGPPVHIALMEDEVVRRRGWISRPQFVDLLGATNLIPGPNSTELAIHIGWQVGGRSGFLIAGVCFIIPAIVIVTLLAWAYVRWGTLPQVSGLLYGIKPVVVVIVIQALWRLGRTSMRTRLLSGVAGMAGVANLCGIHELLVILGAGAIVAAARQISDRSTPSRVLAVAPLWGLPVWPLISSAVATAGGHSFTLWGLFLFFLKVGSVLFGSGYVLLAFLRADLVQRWNWLTESQLLDAIAVGQITPGPIFTTATFIGYLLGGFSGAAIATIGIFLPAFLFVAVSAPFVPRLRSSRLAGAFLDGVNVGSLAVMAIVSWRLGMSAIIDATTVAIVLLTATVVLRYQVNSTWLILGGAMIGLIAR